ncbi:hypothetical protein ACFIOY_34105 [Bradyrhizobium sp. TZ2]
MLNLSAGEAIDTAASAVGTARIDLSLPLMEDIPHALRIANPAGL